MANARRDSGPLGHWRLYLLGGWRLDRDGASVHVTRSGQRLIAFLALRGPSARTAVLGTLWPDVSETQAATNLRTVLHRVRHSTPALLTTNRDEIALRSDVQVDVHALGRAELNVDDDARWVNFMDASKVELLPGWYDDWVLEEGERIRQSWLHAVERRAVMLAKRQDYERALDAALVVAAADPIRESGQRLVIRIHLAEGNVSEAVKTYVHYVDVLHQQLGVLPTARMTKLLAGVSAVPEHAPA